MNPPLATTPVHEELRQAIAEFHGTEDALLFSSCTAANIALLDTAVGAGDTILSDELNHASIIDGIRLSKAQRFRYRNGDIEDLELKLKEASKARRVLVVTDGVFSLFLLSSTNTTAVTATTATRAPTARSSPRCNPPSWRGAGLGSGSGSSSSGGTVG